MINPATLRSKLAEALRASTAVTALLQGDAANVIEYTERGGSDVYSAIGKMKPPAVLVIYQGTQIAGRKEALWAHNFSVSLRPASDVEAADLFTAVVNGLLDTEIDPDYHPMDPPTLSRRSIPVSESTFFDYWEIQTKFVSKGVQ